MITFSLGPTDVVVDIAIETEALPTPTGPNFIIKLRIDGGETMWETPYYRTLPYAPNTGWTDGDRCGYRAAYMFLMRDGVPVGRVTFTRAAGYSAVFDDRMNDFTTRHFDGTLVPEGSDRELGECPEPSIAYEPYLGPDQRPTIRYVEAGQLLEVRDYKHTTSPGTEPPWLVDTGRVKFQQHDASPQRVTIVAHFLDPVTLEFLPAMVVYYDSIVPEVVLTTDLS